VLPSHPFVWADDATQRRMLPVLIVATLVLIGAMGALGEPLRAEASPGGILDFEFARTLERAQAILAGWTPEARIYAGLGLGLDYLFLVAYSATIAFACVRVAAGWPAWARIGRTLSWLQPLAAVLDALENFGLIRLLLGDARAQWAQLAFACAVPKFAIVAAGLSYVLVGALRVAVGRRVGRY
jgi:hypothetical protein